MSRFSVQLTPLDGLKMLTRQPIGDERGYLERIYCQHELAELIEDRQIVQVNHTLTKVPGTIRGMHFQRPPDAEMKLITCLSGEIFDVAVDLRVGSSTYMQWYAERLSSENHRTIVIPEGFAHGFQTLSEDCELLYLHTAPHSPTSEDGLGALDPRLAIDWPLPVVEMSPRDRSHPAIGDEFIGVKL